MGLTLLICTYNGATRLEPTLAHIKALECAPGNEWELIIVDNASTDNTSAAAEALLKDSGVDYRILQEPRPGKNNALESGIQAARMEFISIVDDDNWLSPDWVLQAHRLFRDHPDIGIFGSYNEPVCEVEAPDWFDLVKYRYACGKQRLPGGRTTAEEPIGLLSGAGMTFRKRIWDELMGKGFWFISECLRGKKTAAGEDLEFCLAASRVGNHLMYTDALRMKHYMPADRLEWQYYLRLIRAQGRGYLSTDPHMILRQSNNEISPLKCSWYWRAGSRMRRLLRFPLRYVLFPNSIPEGDIKMAEVTMEIGCILQILQERSRYTAYIKQVQQLV